MAALPQAPENPASGKTPRGAARGVYFCARLWELVSGWLISSGAVRRCAPAKGPPDA
jgi:hypothetical protein